MILSAHSMCSNKCIIDLNMYRIGGSIRGKSLDFSEFLCDKDIDKCVGGIPLYSNQESNFVTKDNWEISLKKVRE